MADVTVLSFPCLPRVRPSRAGVQGGAGEKPRPLCARRPGLLSGVEEPDPGQAGTRLSLASS